MTLLNGVRDVCKRLLKEGWGPIFEAHGLNLGARDLAKELRRELPVDRGVAGFDDFCPDGCRAIEPGSPARSLLYHALASPFVRLPGARPGAYATLGELDTVENYIYSVARRRLEDFSDPVVAVFAYQYRTGSRSPHGLFADLAFSRIGVSRVGTAPAHYDAARRSFWVEPTGGAGIAVMPARYGAFLAESRMPRPSDAVLDEQPADKGRTFLFPVHKLFPGRECLGRGANVTLEFLEYHLNEKLRRVHSSGRVRPIPGFNIDKYPFVRDSRNPGDLVTLPRVGASALVVPRDYPQLVRTAQQFNASTRRREVVRFKVPPQDDVEDNRFWTSFQLSPDGRSTGRDAPEYVNIRHQVHDPADPSRVEDLNLLGATEFARLLRQGGYEAAHFIDDSCDGCVVARVGGLGRHRTRPKEVAAYSLVTAPDFFPLVDQIEIKRWVRRALRDRREQFAQGEPDPLSDGRRPANPNITLPDRPREPAFDRQDETIAAVVGNTHLGPNSLGPAPAPSFPDPSTSFLPDAASNEFDPGWDVSVARDELGEFYAAYGLGSPFPEDAKLCAALNTFWPAAAPDAARTFGLVGDQEPKYLSGWPDDDSPGSPTAIPLLDRELGYHPDHPAVRAGEAVSERGWDGEYGPFFEEVGGRLHVNFASKDRSDYVSNALANQVRVSGLAAVTAEELIARMEALRVCIRALPAPPGSGTLVSTTDFFLVAAEAVEDWALRGDRADQRLRGPGYLYVFALFVVDREGNPREKPAEDLRRVRVAVRDGLRYTCQVTREALCWREGEETFRFVLNR